MLTRKLVISAGRCFNLLQNHLRVVQEGVRLKYMQNTAVKGIRNRKFPNETQVKSDDEENTDNISDINLDDREYNVIAKAALQVTRDSKLEQRVFVVQPYIKWGPNKSTTNPDLHLQEAEALIHSLHNWKVELSVKVPLETLAKKSLFGTGKLEELKDILGKARSRGKPFTCMFVSKGTLSLLQKRFLELEFKLPVMDRYSVVIQILRLHATTAEAKIQVAMAEIPYIWGQMKDSNPSNSRKQGYFLNDTQKEILRTREKKLKTELDNIRSHRQLMRNRRKQKNIPIVAVVGYTNAGKTSLIKALTDEQSMQPMNQLFATLDVTAHSGVLPCNLQVIYMDTVGFMSDIPTGLIECFVSTLEDAMMADVVLHVQDLSHENHMEQKKHVEQTLDSLYQSIKTKNNEDFQSLPKIINVGNKIDLLETKDLPTSLNLISSKHLTGINDLMLEIEKEVLKSTGRRKITMRVKNGGPEMSWLYKNAAVTKAIADPKDQQSLLITVVITDTAMKQFKHYFLSISNK